MKVCFHVYIFSFRGTEVAIFDYALYNERLLKNKSIIICPKNRRGDISEVYEKFKSYFKIIEYNDIQDLETKCVQEGVDVFHVLKYGTNDGVVLKNTKTIVQCVFTTEEPHGDIYSAVSDSVALKNNSNKKYPVVEHIVYLPSIESDYREYLQIPKDAIVIGRHGGEDTFNLPFVKDCIEKILNERSDIWFIFCVKPIALKDFYHDRALYLPSFSDNRVKRKFINTCDYMLHASYLGESFGLSVLEFSICGKGIITWNGGVWHRQHLQNLGEKCIKYNDENELYCILRGLKKEDKNREYIEYFSQKYSPEKIMKDFNTIFLR